MSDISYKVVADSYPDIGKKIQLFWGHQEFSDFAHVLLHDTRDHSRKGFPAEVVAALVDLQTLHNKVFPQFAEVSEASKAAIRNNSVFGTL